MYEQREYKEICRPGMDRSDKPAELHFGHNKLDAFISKVRTSFIIEKEKYTGENLYNKKEYRYASEIIPYGMSVNRYIFFTEEFYQVIKLYPFINPRI